MFAPPIAPHDPSEQNLIATLLPPAWAAGGEPAFRSAPTVSAADVLSRLIYGARVAMTVAVVASFGAMLLGGCARARRRIFRWPVDWLIGRVVDVWMSFPPVILSLILMVGLGVRARNVDPRHHSGRLDALLPGATQRSVGGDPARLCGGGAASGFLALAHITREVMPATLPLLITLMSLEMAIAVVVEAILSFVGLGVGADSPPGAR